MPLPFLASLLSGVSTAAGAAGTAVGSAASALGGAASAIGQGALNALGVGGGAGAAAGGGGGAALGASGGASLAGQFGASAAGTLPGTSTVLGVPGVPTLAQAGQTLLGGNVLKAAGQAGEALGAPQGLTSALEGAGEYSFGPGGGSGGGHEAEEMPLPLSHPLRRNTLQSVFANSRRYGGVR